MSERKIQARAKIILGDRMTGLEFVAVESIGFLAQVAVFFFVAALVSGMFQNQQPLVDYLNSKVNQHTMREFFATVFAVVAVVGGLYAVLVGADRSSSSFLRRVADEVLLELPRVVYALGSSMIGPILAVAVFLIDHPQANVPGPQWWFGMALFFAAFFLAGGVMLSYYLKKRTHIVGDKALAAR